MGDAHLVVLQKNLRFLKKNLHIGPVLDALYEHSVFIDSDYDRCRDAGIETQCDIFLDILKKKGPEGYKELCAALDSTQPYIKEQLDQTSTEAGNSDLVYVNKFKLEAQHKKELAEKDRQIAVAQSAMEKLEEQIKQKDMVQAELEDRIEKEREEHMTQRKKQDEEAEALKTTLSKSNDDLQQSRAECGILEKRLQEEQEAYDALQGVPRSQSPDSVHVGEEVQQADSTERMCQFSTKSCCDGSQLCLLPCLHSACKPCIDHQVTQAKQNCIQCPFCGREFNMEQTAVDHVRRNEAAYTANVDGEKKCNYIEGDHDAKAVMYCHECASWLCSDCHKIHKPLKPNQNHSVIEINQAENIPMKQWLKEPDCREHTDNKPQLYDHTCKQAICLLCVHGAHKDHKIEDLNHAYEKAKGQLEEQVQKQRLKLKDVTDRMGTVTSHQTELGIKQRKLEQDATTVFKRVAVRFLHRQRQLMKDIHASIQAPNEMVNEKLDTLHDVHTEIISTIDYTQSTLESTRQEELITLTDVLQKKSDENLKRKLPEDNTQDTRILLSFQGQKALMELIDTFGGLASSLDLDQISDKQPTLQDLQKQIKQLAFKEEETSVVHEGRWLQHEEIIRRISGSVTSGDGSQELQPEQLTSEELRPEQLTPEELQPEQLTPEELRPEQLTSEELRPEQLTPEELQPEQLTPQELQPEQLTPEELQPEELTPEKLRPEELTPEELRPEELTPEELQPEELTREELRPEQLTPQELQPEQLTPEENCSMHRTYWPLGPKLQLDAARANTGWCHVTTDGELVNSPRSTQHKDRGRLQMYGGTCSSTPIPLPPPRSNVISAPHMLRYWETHSRVGVKWGVYESPLLEMGVVEESQVDSEMYVCLQGRSWGVSVGSCSTHWGSFCTRVWLEGDWGKCYRNTISYTPGTHATLHYGVMLDVGRGRIAFIDMDREVVLRKANVEFREALLPVFGVGRPDLVTVKMKLISGEEIVMTDTKRSLINEALAKGITEHGTV